MSSAVRRLARLRRPDGRPMLPRIRERDDIANVRHRFLAYHLARHKGGRIGWVVSGSRVARFRIDTFLMWLALEGRDRLNFSIASPNPDHDLLLRTSRPHVDGEASRLDVISDLRQARGTRFDVVWVDAENVSSDVFIKCILPLAMGAGENGLRLYMANRGRKAVALVTPRAERDAGVP